jgi:sarcosine oxidase delta subunit
VADRFVTVKCAVDCPHCDEDADVEFDALAGTGTVPRERVWCESCGLQFVVSATIDIGVSA